MTSLGLLGRTMGLLGRDAVRAITAIGLMTALLRVIEETNLPERGVVDVIHVLFGAGLQWWIISGVLLREGLARRRDVPALPFVALATVTTIGVLVGFTLLVVPGFILTVRWSAAMPAMVSERLTLRDALAESRETTRPAARPIMRLYAVFYGAFAALLTGIGMADPNDETWLATSPLPYTIGQGVIVVGWYIGLAVWLECGQHRRMEALSRIFA